MCNNTHTHKSMSSCNISSELLSWQYLKHKKHSGPVIKISLISMTLRFQKGKST